MTKEQRTRAINLMWEGQEFGQFLMELAVTPRERSIAAALKDACWALYQILDDDRRKEKNNDLNRSCVHGSSITNSCDKHEQIMDCTGPKEPVNQDVPTGG